MAFAATFAGQSWSAIDTWSQTFDEALHLAAGYSYLTTGEFELNVEHPPLMKELAALPVLAVYGDELPLDASHEQPWIVGRDFLYGSSVGADELLWLARLPSLALGSFLVALVGLWAFRLWGLPAAAVAMGLAAFEPLLIAHSSLATTDIGAATFYVATCYATWEYSKRPGFIPVMAAGIFAGLALASKFSGTLVLPVLALGLVSVAPVGRNIRPKEVEAARDTSPWDRIASAMEATLAISLIAVLVLWATYLFGDPQYWWRGVQAQWHHQEIGHPAYFWGEYATSGWTIYFPMAFLLKTSLGTLVLLAVSLTFWRFGIRMTSVEWAFLVLPAICFLLAAMMSHVNIGARYLLPIYPFAIIVASRSATLRPRLGLLVAASGVTWSAIATASAAPNYIAYFNGLCGGPANGMRVLGDSNVDWGQDLRGLAEFLEHGDHPTVYLAYFGTADPTYFGIAYQELPTFNPARRASHGGVVPLKGRQLVVISVTNLQGIYLNPASTYAEFANRSPVARIGHSLFVYDVTGEVRAHRELAAIYRTHGQVAFAEREEQKAALADTAPSP